MFAFSRWIGLNRRMFYNCSSAAEVLLCTTSSKSRFLKQSHNTTGLLKNPVSLPIHSSKFAFHLFRFTLQRLLIIWSPSPRDSLNPSVYVNHWSWNQNVWNAGKGGGWVMISDYQAHWISSATWPLVVRISLKSLILSISSGSFPPFFLCLFFPGHAC